MPIALGTHPKRALALISAFVAAFALALALAMATPPISQAHDTNHCVHYDVRNGGWYTDYIAHYWYGSAHYHIYDHLLYGRFQHRELNLCN